MIIQDDTEYLRDKLESSIKDLTCLEEYEAEVRTGKLEWSPVHRSEIFWRENASRLNDNNYELLKILIHLLRTSNRNLVLSVACFDVGEYVRHHPRGKHVLEQLGGKKVVLKLLEHDDSDVKRIALSTSAKIMVHNWQYLDSKINMTMGKKNIR
jgi:V-type H+-transporting ATPase subunit H